MCRRPEHQNTYEFAAVFDTAFHMRFPGSKKKEEVAYSSVEVDASRSDTDVSSQPSTKPLLPGWPAGPQRVSSAPLWLVADVLLLLMPVAFLALAALAYKLDGKELSSRGRKIQEAILLSPTVYPLTFAALGGRGLKKIALWRAQEGTTLGFLEHVIGSQSLVATVGHAISLRSLNLLTLGLLALWALSPLGGQSALRLVYESNQTVLQSHTIFYASVDASSQFLRGDNNVNELNRVNSVVSTALTTIDTLEQSPVDVWNHPKIPRLEELELAESNNETSRPWYTLDRNGRYNYAALTGMNVINLSSAGTTNVTVPYEYMYFGCALSDANNITTMPLETGLYQLPYFPTQVRYLRDLEAAGLLQSSGQFNSTNDFSIEPTSTSSNTLFEWMNFFFYTRGKRGQRPEALLYGSKQFSTTFFLFECSMKSVMVEANIVCEAKSCGVERLRRLHIPRANRSGTLLPYDVINQDDGFSTFTFLKYLIGIGGGSPLATSNPVDTYIYGNAPWDGLAGEPSDDRPRKNWTEYFVEPQRSVGMSQRLTRVLNTFWDASRWPLAMTRNDPFGSLSINQTSGEPNIGMTMNKTEATVTRQVPIYRANAGWVASLVMCSSVLLLLGICNVVLSLLTTAPDVFDYVSSFTRDNPYVDAPPGGSNLDGAERARLMRNIPVQLGDADAGADVGYITIRSIEGRKDREQGRIRKDRMYR